MPLVRERIGPLAHHLQHILRQIGGVRVLEAPPPKEPVDQGGIERDEAPPRLAIVCVAKPEEKANMGRRRLAHGNKPVTILNHVKISGAGINFADIDCQDGIAFSM